MIDRVRISIAQGDHVESLWAKSLGQGLYEIDNIPFGLVNISLGDVVQGHVTTEGNVEFDALHRKSGVRTVRVSIKGGTPAEKRVTELLQRVQFPFETYDGLFTVSVPAGAPFDDFLVDLEVLRGEGVGYVKLDPNPAVEVPVVPGSPAEQQRATQQDDAWAQLMAFAGDEKPKT